MMLRPKHSFESVINDLATGLASGSIRLSTEFKEADKPTSVAAQESVPTPKKMANARFHL